MSYRNRAADAAWVAAQVAYQRLKGGLSEEQAWRRAQGAGVAAGGLEAAAMTGLVEMVPDADVYVGPGKPNGPKSEPA